jgi:hypothetical protein
VRQMQLFLMSKLDSLILRLWYLYVNTTQNGMLISQYISYSMRNILKSRVRRSQCTGGCPR